MLISHPIITRPNKISFHWPQINQQNKFPLSIFLSILWKIGNRFLRFSHCNLATQPCYKLTWLITLFKLNDVHTSNTYAKGEAHFHLVFFFLARGWCAPHRETNIKFRLKPTLNWQLFMFVHLILFFVYAWTKYSITKKNIYLNCNLVLLMAITTIQSIKELAAKKKLMWPICIRHGMPKPYICRWEYSLNFKCKWRQSSGSNAPHGLHVMSNVFGIDLNDCCLKILLMNKTCSWPKFLNCFIWF